MAVLKIKVKAKLLINWGVGNILFIREVDTTKNTSITYSNAVGQSFTAGQILYSTGIKHNTGYLEVRSRENTTLNGSGTFNLSIEHYPTATEGNKQLSFNVDESPMVINFTYNSQPSITDVIVETNNRATYTFTQNDFTSHYSDYDNDNISEIQINGDVSGYKFNDSNYIAGTWISITDIASGKLKYEPIDQSQYYEKDNTWKAKDNHGNISIN